MARPSKLSPAQWAEIERRLHEGEMAAALAREFCISQSQITRRFSQVTQIVAEVAGKVAEARSALAELPPAQQYRALNLADKLRNISVSLASAAELGAATAHRLQSLANSEVQKIDDADPLSSMENLKGVRALTDLANGASSIALNLLAANKETVQKIAAGDQEKEAPAPIRQRLGLEDWKKAHGLV